MKLIKFEDDEFPDCLRKIESPPKQLWAEGNISLLKTNGISIVGSRHCTEYGERWAEIFTKGLLEYDVTIISGMAIGIDTVAHETALKYGGKTIAVLPCGFNCVYPEKNSNLYEKIIKNGGLVISEFPPDKVANKEFFLKRNRIVSGLSFATLVIEAAYRSGTSVTARLAHEQGKLVFSVPGSLDNLKSVGTNKLIQNGANLVVNVEDIVKNYNFLEKKIKISLKVDVDVGDIEKEIENVTEEYRDIYGLILKKPMNINQIVHEMKIPINEIMSKLTMLELDGKIERKAGDMFFGKMLSTEKVPKKYQKSTENKNDMHLENQRD